MFDKNLLNSISSTQDSYDIIVPFSRKILNQKYFYNALSNFTNDNDLKSTEKYMIKENQIELPEINPTIFEVIFELFIMEIWILIISLLKKSCRFYLQVLILT
ncbi:uncharacterized protein OCT59_004481 [Rhizophagus irregularis]|uniref:uncharacterized protein n=1 Tax=Rhizophagus irregularis TaxID=588596 RepID=UPI0019F31840|nr:hypothetical protein OCT59_004481 [Rhizophagus irregularis]GBC54301.2 hypothetical protein GLOIN_2v1605033 [Rhizophagus irregularis DAOM 181602=DAOM 197198]